MKKRRIISTLFCVGLSMICIAGCGSSADNVAIDEEVRTSDDANDDLQISENAGTDEQIGYDNHFGEDMPSVTDDIVEEQEESAEEDEMSLERLSLSILGDSISTYAGYMPDEGFVAAYPNDGGVTDVSQTWWMKLLEDTGMELCSNDSCSGSTCTGESLNVVSIGHACTDYRILLLTGEQGEMPDIIIVYLGTNDLLCNIELGDNDGTREVEDGGVWIFSDAYTLILDKLSDNYPDAQIYCCTLAPTGDLGTDQQFITYTNDLGLTSEDYSERIRIIAGNKGIPVIDLLHCGIETDNLHEMTSDGIHLTSDGMECVERAIMSAMGFTQE